MKFICRKGLAQGEGGDGLPAGPGNEGRKFEMPGPYPQFTLEIRLSFNPKG